MPTNQRPRNFRIFLWLLVLLLVGATQYLTQYRATRWDHTLWAVIYPINGDNSAVTTQYIAGLTPENFESLGQFFSEEAKLYSLPLAEPVTFKLAPPVKVAPPRLPKQPFKVYEVMLWSLKLRYWAWRHDSHHGPRADIRMFVVYHDPAITQSLEHSVGLSKGMLGVVNAFAAKKQSGMNNVVIAHELLHTVGATDKYDLATNQPIYPDGYAEPERPNRYPQRFAEIMGGRIPLSQEAAEMPHNLDFTLIGPLTAREINWRK